jgi:hypothetical protein
MPVIAGESSVWGENWGGTQTMPTPLFLQGAALAASDPLMGDALRHLEVEGVSALLALGVLAIGLGQSKPM